ncbi:IPT/TIG domain-containing protein [Methanogenium sp. S4BF]|uniref:IPT/TIG domain-containing protein n=1 Tax=Methanogenium sp. S4BF TaxID=1789226 RepID=UPI0024162FA4|nr:IPT/TIG domain-containing protein [Methanogenium sp. S4BF]WFN34388.1 IPT/TIG domain-containing protein [Methanogenium sp. S4BF]
MTWPPTRLNEGKRGQGDEAMTKKFMILALAVILITLTGVAGVAAAGISDVSPSEGTVGTKLTITGSGFGDKRGEVLLGDDKLQVVDWSDTEIICKVFKVHPAGDYTITVLMQGDKKAADPMTYAPFTIQKPEILEEEGLTLDGDIVTIAGNFFGDKQGVIRLAYVDVEEEMEIEIEKGKIVDWSMNSTSFRVPEGLTGRFILKVDNVIGSDYALFDLGGSPPLPGMEWPDGWGQFESSDNARGIYYNDRLYVFSIWYSSTKIFSDDFYRIQVRTFRDGYLSGASQLWDGTSYAEPAPLVVQYPNGPEKLFVFVTGRNGNLYFTRLNGNVWEDADWLKIQDDYTGNYLSTKENGWEVAPVYNPLNHRLYIYYAKDYDKPLYWAFSDDFGDTWYDAGPVFGSPNVKAPPGAVYYAPDGSDVRALVAVKDESQKIRVCNVSAGVVYNSKVMETGDVSYLGRPFLTDLGDGTIALVYAEDHDPGVAYNPDTYVPMIMKLDKTTGVWGAPYQPYTLPDLGAAQGTYRFYWQPNGAVLDGVFYLFYGFDLTAWYADENEDGPWWMFTDIEAL